MEASGEAGEFIWTLSQVFDGMVGVALLCIHLLSLLRYGACMHRGSNSAQSCSQQERRLKRQNVKETYFIIAIRIFGGAE